MTQIPNSKQYDLEDRTFLLAKRCREFVSGLPRTVQNVEDGKQLVRSSGSVAANYIEANESLSKKDFLLRVKISKKEAKESLLWLRLLNAPDDIRQETTEIMRIMGAILEKAH